MATLTETRYTPDDLLKITDRPMPELIDGRLIRCNAGQYADAVATTVLCILARYAEVIRPGVVNGGRCGFRISADDPDKVRVASVAYTRAERLPEGPARGHARIAPDLAVVVLFPGDLADVVLTRVWDFLAAGTAWVWLIDPASRTIQTFGNDGRFAIRKVGDMLDGGDILPGFSCNISDMFT